MHKVVLSVKDESELNSVSTHLTQSQIPHRVWIEAPENFPACLATLPCRRAIIKPILSHLKLFR